MKAGDVLTVEVADLDEDGAGVGPVAGGSTLEAHVRGALPGERVTAHLEHLSTHRPLGWALLRAVDRPSPHRVAPACAAWGPCGGCLLQHFDYGAQLSWKERRLRALVGAHGALGGVAVEPVVPSPRVLGYRNKSKLVAGRGADGRLILGAYAPRSHHVVDLAGCAVVEPPLDQVAGVVCELLAARGIEPYDETNLQGLLRYVILRATASGAVLATLVTSREAFPAGPELAAALGAARPEVAGVVQNVNPTRGNAIYGPREVTLAGTATVEDQIGGVRLRVSSQAFLQANRHVAAAAYAAIARGLAPRAGDRVVDAYAGVGGIALTLAPHLGTDAGAGDLLGIEEHPAAVEDAAASATLNGVAHARFVAGDVAVRLAEAGRADLVVLNPPRKGCARAVLATAAALGPRAIGYLSCAPDTLLRDLAILAELGYRTRAITPFDMLPHTPHLEALAIVDRAR